MLTFAVCSLVAGRVAERARKQKHQAEQRREDVERLYLLSQEMMLHEDAAASDSRLASAGSQDIRARKRGFVRAGSGSVCVDGGGVGRAVSKPICAK